CGAGLRIQLPTVLCGQLRLGCLRRALAMKDWGEVLILAICVAALLVTTAVAEPHVSQFTNDGGAITGGSTEYDTATVTVVRDANDPGTDTVPILISLPSGISWECVSPAVHTVYSSGCYLPQGTNAFQIHVYGTNPKVITARFLRRRLNIRKTRANPSRLQLHLSR